MFSLGVSTDYIFVRFYKNAIWKKNHGKESKSYHGTDSGCSYRNKREKSCSHGSKARKRLI